MMENQPNTLGSIFENSRDYLETRLELIKLQAVNKTSEVASSLVSKIIVFFLIGFAMIFINIALALLVGELLGRSYLGFLVVAGFYIIIALLIHIFRNSWIKDPISTSLIKKMLN